MPCILLLPLAVQACTPSPEEFAMRRVEPESQAHSNAAAADPARRGLPVPGTAGQAAVGPTPQSVSAADNPLPAPIPADSPAARGRRVLSTAFVRVGPGGHLIVELRDGRVLALRDVTFGPDLFRGVQVAGSARGAKFRGRYAEVAAARPGGTPIGVEPDLAADNPLPPGHAPNGR